MTSPTQRTLALLKAKGLKYAVVERFLSHVGPHGKRQDMFGIIDIVALDHKRGVIGVQSCGTAFSEHVNKLFGEGRQSCIDWLSTPGAMLVLVGWRKLKLKRGGKAVRWTPRIQWFKLEDFEDE